MPDKKVKSMTWDNNRPAWKVAEGIIRNKSKTFLLATGLLPY
jgi:hypothetical protein